MNTGVYIYGIRVNGNLLADMFRTKANAKKSIEMTHTGGKWNNEDEYQVKNFFITIHLVSLHDTAQALR